MQLDAGTQLERYLIQGVLGEGAMAVVYQAQHSELGSLHAIKHLKVPGERIRERLVQEGRLQSSLRHPNVLSVTDLLNVNGSPALVMEFVAGPTLGDLMANQELTPDQSDALARDLLKGVAAAHAHGLVHRDLKPANVLIAVTSDALIPKVSDFGLAKVLETDGPPFLATQSGATMGTPAYMAPEQIRDSSTVDARADVFSLGAILYELMTGEMCFGGGSVMEIWERICAGEFRPVTELAPNLPNRMVRAIEDSLVVDPEHRVSSVDALIHRWCSDDDGQHVEITGRQSLDFWPHGLRTGTSAMAPTLERSHRQESPVEEVDSSTLVFVANDTLDPSFESTGSTATLPAPTDSPRSRHLIPAILTAGVLGAAAMWWNQQDTEAPVATSMSESTSEPLSGESTSEPLSESRLFVLDEAANDVEHQSFDTACRALLSGEFPLAERHLSALVIDHPDDPVLHSLLSITHFFRGRLGLSATEAERAAFLVRDQGTELETLLVLANRSWREPTNADLLLQWERLRDRQVLPMVDVLYLVSTRFILQADETLEQIESVRAEMPEWVVWTAMELSILSENGMFEEMRSAAEGGISRFPTASGLRLSLAMALMRLDRGEEAEPHLEQVLRDDGSLTAARTLLSELYLERQDEEARLEQVMLAMGDTTAPYEQVLYLEEHGRQLSAHGRLEEAEKYWNFCMETAQESGDQNGALNCAATALYAMQWLLPADRWVPWQARVQEVTSHPAVDADLKQLHTLVLLQTEAIAAAQQGDLEAARSGLAEIEAIDAQQNPLDIQRWLVRAVRREIALQGRDAAALQDLLTGVTGASEASGLARGCTSLWTEILIRRALDEGPLVMSLSEQLLREDCRPGIEQAWILASLRGTVAEQKLHQGELEAARELVADFERDWPAPDADLPAVQVIQAVKEGM